MPKKLFVIDDDIEHTERLVTTLPPEAFTVSRALDDGENIFEQIQREQPEFVLVNNRFPAADDIIAYLKHRSLPFVFLGDDTAPQIGSAYRQGALGLLLKPVNIQQLIVEIEICSHWHWEKMQLNRRKENIDTTITNNRKISTAIGIVMERYQITGHDSFEILRGTARNKRCRIIDIADKIIAAHENPSLSATANDLASNETELPKRDDRYLGQIRLEIARLLA